MQDTRRFDELYNIVVATKIDSTRANSLCLLDRQPWYYVCLTVFVVALWVISIIWIRISAEHFFLSALAATILFAFAVGQGALLDHDAGHNQISQSAWADRLTDIKAAILLGIYWPFWRKKHGEHHAKPNTLDKDPDIGIAFLNFAPSQCEKKKGFYRFTAAYQHRLLPLLALFEWWHLRMASVKYLLKRRDTNAVWQMLLIICHVCLYAAFWYFVFGPLKGVLLLCIHTGLVGLYMSAVFVVNHLGMPILTNEENEKLDYLEAQVRTSRNIHGGSLIRVIFGGLNFQVEHHLFPYAPRNMLRLIQPIVEAFCREKGISYTKVSVFKGYRDVIRYLRRESAPLRRTKQLQG